MSSYALRIAIMPTITLIAVAFGGMLSSAVFVGSVFTRPGIGTLIIDAANMRNFPVVKGTVLIMAALFCSRHPIADLLIAWLDPRVRERSEELNAPPGSAAASWRRVTAIRWVPLGLILVVIVVFCGVFAPWITPYDPLKSMYRTNSRRRR